MTTFETYGHYIYGKWVTKRLNKWKYKSHRQKNMPHPQICKLCFRWFFQTKNVLKLLWRQFEFDPNYILDEIIGMYLVHSMWIGFHLYLWWLRDYMEYVKTQMVIYILWSEVFEALITHTIWYFSCKWCPHISHCDNFWKERIYFLHCIFLLEAVSYQHNLTMKFCEWGCTYPGYLGSHILQCVKPPPHPL